MTVRRMTIGAISLLMLVATACGTDDTSSPESEPVIDPGDGGAYTPAIDPARFSTLIDNPYLPYIPGAAWVYEGATEDGEIERIEVTVTDDRKIVYGVETIVVHDVVSIEGEVIEDTYDWYAQDREGNVWYFGEDSTSYDEGTPSTAGSWEAGVRGALPGIVMPASPSSGRVYREEFASGEAEDMAKVVDLDGSIDTPFGSFDGLVVTINWTPLEPQFVERKYYAESIGLVYETFDLGPEEVVELISYTGP